MEGLKKYFKKEIPSVGKSLKMQTAFLKSKETPLYGLEISLGASQGVLTVVFHPLKSMFLHILYLQCHLSITYN